MSERELGKELLNRAGLGPADPDTAGSPVGSGEPREEARCAICRATRRVRILAACTVALWTVVAAGAFLAVLGFFTYFYPALVAMADDRPMEPEKVKTILRLLAYLTVYTSGAWAALLVLASVLTVAFVMISRQATLRQIQVSLDELVAEIRKGPAQGGP